VHTLIPQVGVLESHLSQFAQANSATEVVVFERSTFLVISRTTQGGSTLPVGASGFARPTGLPSEDDDDMEGFPEERKGDDKGRLNPERFEKISELIKSFKLSCS
jgi:Ras-related GTP-binding protein A/B